MRLFLDTSVLLAAALSEKGASREVIRQATARQWDLIVTPYVMEEVIHNLPNLPVTASASWAALQRKLLIRPDVLTCNRPVIFPAAKDRPILLGALAWADVLLTLDQTDFEEVIGKSFYGLAILRPGLFLRREQAIRPHTP